MTTKPNTPQSALRKKERRDYVVQLTAGMLAGPAGQAILEAENGHALRNMVETALEVIDLVEELA